MIQRRANCAVALVALAAVVLASSPRFVVAMESARSALAETPRDSASASDSTRSEEPDSTQTLAADSAATTLPVELAASTAPPWVPERPIREAEPWERALRMPGYILTLPLSGMGIVTKRTLLAIEETNFVNRLRVTFEPVPRAGFLVLPAALGDRTGFGLGIAYSPPVLRRHLTARWEGSTLKYNRTRVDAAYGPARLGYRYDWRPRERFFGIGPASDRDDRSSYAAQSQAVRLGLESRWPIRPDADSPRFDFAGWIGPREIITRHGRGKSEPSFEEVFPALTPDLDQRIEHLVYGGRLALDHRRGVPHWGEGGRMSLEVERFDRPVESLALRTTHTSFRFTRWTYDAEGGVSFRRDPRTLRLELRVVDQVPDASGSILVPDLATLGGGAGLAGFESGRFHDLDSALGRLSYIFPLADRLEMDLHVESGQVAHDVWKNTALSTLRQSFGIALRPRLDTGVLGVIGMDWSREGGRVRFSVGGVE